MEKKKYGSSRRGKRRQPKEKSTSTIAKSLKRQLTALDKLRDEDIDTSDIPEVLDWSGAEVGKFYRPLKRPVTIRLDLDVLAWLRAQGKGYQTRINALLRGAMRQRSGSKARRRN